jgi:hypothetical protein
LIKECKIKEEMEKCTVDTDFVEFKPEDEKKRNDTSGTERSVESSMDTNMEMNSELNTAENEPSDLGLTCLRCRRSLSPSLTGKHHKNALKPTGVLITQPCPEAAAMGIYKMPCTFLLFWHQVKCQALLGARLHHI